MSFFKSFKQYLDFKYNYHCKVICGLKKARLLEIQELTNADDEQSADMFRTMKATIVRFDGKGQEISDFVSAGLDEETIEDPRYMQIFLGMLPFWHLVKVDLYTSGANFIYYKYDEGGNVIDWNSVSLEIPPYIEIQIQIEGCVETPSECYNLVLKSDRHNNSVGYEYRQGKLVHYKGEIKEDRKGTYELITEVE